MMKKSVKSKVERSEDGTRVTIFFEGKYSITKDHPINSGEGTYKDRKWGFVNEVSKIHSPSRYMPGKCWCQMKNYKEKEGWRKRLKRLLGSRKT